MTDGSRQLPGARWIWPHEAAIHRTKEHLSMPAPAAATSRTKASRSTPTRDERSRIVDLFAFPALANLAVVLADARADMSSRGRRSPYSDTCLLAVAACARITGSTASALNLLSSDEDLWQRCRAAFERVHGETLPTTAPDRDRVNYLRKKITDPRRPLLTALVRAFSVAAVGQAQALGNLHPGVQPQWAEPDVRHAIFGDGTIVKPYSDVTAVANPITGKVHYIGSRANTGTPKLQRACREVGTDDKPGRGINFVSMHTRTSAGRVVLAVDSELGAEAWTALDLIERVMAVAGDGVHSVVYDRALTGWHTAYLMGAHRVQLFGEAVSRPKDLDAIDTESQLSERLRRATIGVTTTTMTRAAANRTVLERIYFGGRPQPVGISLYPSRNAYDLVHSAYRFLTATHTTTDGLSCEHDLVMDDGALFTVEVDDLSEQLVKRDHLTCVDSSARRVNSRRWQRVSTYEIPCAGGHFRHELTWTPETTRYTRDSTDIVRAPKDAVGSRLHPVSRRDGKKFEFVDRARNDVEGYNSWFKGTLPGQSSTRGSALSREGQMLDFLLAAVVQNSITWAEHLRNG
ncbi:hypothetical protein [Cellulomonas septica]|uniref:Transposase n=1 Tax=Cellulomonas septica TaxID=285080 RepID=A0ABX1JV15_9CELL|nr:hypothetical protein [Cellulomonas septica]NKY38153.1 hypothetical protein [Cellulomonas septica]